MTVIPSQHKLSDFSIYGTIATRSMLVYKHSIDELYKTSIHAVKGVKEMGRAQLERSVYKEDIKLS